MRIIFTVLVLLSFHAFAGWEVVVAFDSLCFKDKENSEWVLFKIITEKNKVDYIQVDIFLGVAQPFWAYIKK